MSALVGLRLCYRTQPYGDYYYWDLNLPTDPAGSAWDDEVDILVLRPPASGVQLPKSSDLRCPDTAKYARLRLPGDPYPRRRGEWPHPDRLPNGAGPKGPSCNRAEHCVWVHRTDCNWEQFCGGDTPGSFGQQHVSGDE